MAPKSAEANLDAKMKCHIGKDKALLGRANLMEAAAAKLLDGNDRKAEFLSGFRYNRWHFARHGFSPLHGCGHIG